ncbi:hypothetical protein [Streptomyces sp. NPDC091217]|uniref:recombination directionality factor n=1 Tax=Streptomyces sp. NPDC091217 TaxID=3365975 RepID=UPI00382D58DD
MLPTWRVMTLTADVAEGVAGIFGGESRGEIVAGRQVVEVLTNTSRVDLVIHNLRDCYGDMRLYGMREEHETRVEVPSVRPELSAVVQGPRPFIRLRFRLADDPTLGRFEFHGSSWALARDLAPVLEALHTRTLSAVHCALSIEGTVSRNPRSHRRGPALEPRLRLVEGAAPNGPEC